MKPAHCTLCTVFRLHARGYVLHGLCMWPMIRYPRQFRKTLESLKYYFDIVKFFPAIVSLPAFDPELTTFRKDNGGGPMPLEIYLPQKN